jgi:putative nucleotidyltransferase with HDIG domain
MTTNINDLAPPAWAAAGILPEQGVRLSEVVSALSYALDITEGQSEGHAVRSCIIGMRIGQIMGLGEAERSDLFYALLLKDLGCSSNAARLCNLFGADDLSLKQAHKLNDWTNPKASASYAMSHVPGGHAIAKAWSVLVLAVKGRGSGREMVETRCERGADIARMLDLSNATQAAIRSLDEHWDGHGLPMGISGDGIPLLARICCLAQTVEVFHAAHGQPAAYEMARSRSGTWFDPALVDALESFEFDASFWSSLRQGDPRALVAVLEPKDRIIVADSSRIDSVAEAFARVIDAKSPYTGQHSGGVARIAIGMAAHAGLPREERTLLRRAALLHDIGKLGVSNLILDKPGKLTDIEMAMMRQHPRHTEAILGRVRAFRDVASVAARHHERLDGLGYHSGLPGEKLGRLDRMLAVADVCEALSATRPYRAALPPAEVRKIIRDQAGTALCAEAVEMLEGVGIRHDERPVPPVT